jgi:hypothetical protein
MAKPRKVQEPAGTRAVKARPEKATADMVPSPAGVRYATPEQVREATEKVFRVHDDLFRRLAEYDRGLSS